MADSEHVPGTDEEDLPQRGRRRLPWAALLVTLVAAVAVASSLVAISTSKTKPAVSQTRGLPNKASASTETSASTTSTTAATSTQQAASTSFVDMSWVNAQDGWILEEQPCGNGSCPLLLQTIDGGQQWRKLPNPPAHMDYPQGCDFYSENCGVVVGSLLFTTPTVGYLYGLSLLMTTDGGQTWEQQAGSLTDTMGVVDDRVLRIISENQPGCNGDCGRTLQSAEVGSSSWQDMIHFTTSFYWYSSKIFTYGSSIYIGFFGNTVKGAQWATIYRSTDAGRTWHTLSDPCSSFHHLSILMSLTVNSSGFIAGLCDNTLLSNSSASMVVSDDYGSSWKSLEILPDPYYPSMLTAATSSEMVVLGESSDRGDSIHHVLLTSDDGGASWSVTASDTQSRSSLPQWLEFQSPDVGRWVSNPTNMWTTRDGGHTWTESRLPLT